MNRDWHMLHKMPTPATEQQRLKWHLEHARNCSCRPFPKGLLAMLGETEKLEVEEVARPLRAKNHQ